MVTRQQFLFTDKTVGITTIKFANAEINPILVVEKIVFFKETELVGNWVKKEFRFSFDYNVWSTWRTLTQSALQNIDFSNHPNFYLEIVYTRDNYSSADIKDFYLFYDSAVLTQPDPSAGIIDADLLQGEPGSYYLNPENFIGAYSNINVYNIEDPSAAGVYSHRTDTSVGTDFHFKGIKGKGSIVVIDGSDGIITIDASAGEGASEYHNVNPVLNTVGGIGSGDTFFDPAKDFGETMQAMFYPTLYPNLTAPTNVFSDNQIYLQTIGDSITIQYTAAINRGFINPQYTATSPYRSGEPNTYHYNLIGDIRTVPETSLSNAQTLNHTVTQGVQTSSSYVSYDAGVQPKDSIGDDFDSPLSAGNTSTKTTTFEGVYPLFGTTSIISNPNTKQLLVSMITENNVEFGMVAETGGYKQSFDIPEAWTDSRPLQNIQTFSTVSQSWETTGLATWTTSILTHSVKLNNVNYTRYTYNGTDRSDINIRLVF